MVRPKPSARVRVAVLAELFLLAASVPLILVDQRLGWYVLLAAMLLPIVAVSAILIARIIRRDRWYRNGLAVLLVFTGASAIVSLASLLVWYPFLPLQWTIDEVPLAFSVPMLAGFYGFAIGILIFLGISLVATWRAHRRARAVIGGLLLIPIVLLMVALGLYLAG